MMIHNQLSQSSEVEKTAVVRMTKRNRQKDPTSSQETYPDSVEENEETKPCERKSLEKFCRRMNRPLRSRTTGAVSEAG